MRSLALVTILGGLAEAQDFADFRTVGQLEQRRSEPSPLIVLGHSFAPSLLYKLFEVTTPHVFGATRLAYSDNYLRADPSAPGVTQRRELFAEFSAGLRLDTEISDHRLELGYQATALELVNSGDGDTLNQDATLRLDLYGNDIDAHVDAGWSRDAFPQNIQLRGITVLDRYYGESYVDIRFARFGVRVGGGVEAQDYLRRSLSDLDSLSYDAQVQLYWRLKSRLRLLAEYDYLLWTYRRGDKGSLNDYHLHSLLAGVDGEITAKISASLKGGVGYQKVEHGPNPDGRDLSTFLAQASLVWSPLERTTITLSYAKSIQPSANSNGLQTDDVRLSVEQQLWKERLTAAASFGYTHSIVTPGDHLNYLSGNASLTFDVTEWCSIVADYRFEKLTSAFPDNDYTVHEVGISIGFGL